MSKANQLPRVISTHPTVPWRDLAGARPICSLQDPRRKRFLGMLPRLQPLYDGPTQVESLDRSRPVFATFTNAAPVYIEQLLNWAFHLRDLQLPHLVVCLDPESEEIARTNGLPWVPVENQTTSEDVRNDHATFRAMVSRKVRRLYFSQDLAQYMLFIACSNGTEQGVTAVQCRLNMWPSSGLRAGPCCRPCFDNPRGLSLETRRDCHNMPHPLAYVKQL